MKGILRTLAFALVALSPTVAMPFLDRPPFDGGGATYLRYKEIWGGSPNEVFSHFLDLVLMSGNAAALGALLLLEAWFRKQDAHLAKHTSITKWTAGLGLATSGLLAMWLDSAHGEGTVVIVYPFGFLPVLVAQWMLLRRLAERFDWRISPVAVIAAVSALIHAALQYVYEPSVTGGPSALILPLWLVSLGYLLREAFATRLRVKP